MLISTNVLSWKKEKADLRDLSLVSHEIYAFLTNDQICVFQSFLDINDDVICLDVNLIKL